MFGRSLPPRGGDKTQKVPRVFSIGWAVSDPMPHGEPPHLPCLPRFLRTASAAPCLGSETSDRDRSPYGIPGGAFSAGFQRLVTAGCLQRAAYGSCPQRLSTAAVHSGCLSGCLSGFPFCVKTSQYIAPCSCASAAQGDGGFVMPCAPRRTVSLRAVRSPCGGGATSRETRKDPALPYS